MLGEHEIVHMQSLCCDTDLEFEQIWLIGNYNIYLEQTYLQKFFIWILKLHGCFGEFFYICELVRWLLVWSFGRIAL